jgi:hypothetical protein
MIIITTPRKIGELGRHLAKTGRGSNKQVIVRDDLIRDAPLDTTLALRIMAALSRQNRRVKRDIVHIKIAPKVALSPEALERVLQVIQEEYGIPFDAPRHIVEHRKGKRAHHFHVNYPMFVPGQDGALRFTRSEERDEMIARRLEIEFGEGLTPSLRVHRVAEMLRERGLSSFADIAATGPAAEKGLSRSKAEFQQAVRLEADPDLVDERLLEGWRRSGEDLHRLPEELEKLGFRLAAGDKLVAGAPAVRLIDTETLFATSLTRDLNRVRKANGDHIRIQEPELGAAIGELPSEAAVKAELRREAPQRSAADLLGEFDRLVAEAEADGEREEAAKARQGRARVAARLSTEEKEDLRTRQGRVRERYRQRDRIRRARVNRVFIAAGVFADPSVRKLAFYLVAAGALATGAGLLAALTIAGVAVAGLPSFTSARRARADAAESLAQDRVEQEVELRDTARAFFRERAIALRIADEKRRARERQAHLGAALRRRNQKAAHRQQTESAGLSQQAAKRAADYQRAQVAQRIAARRKPKVPGGGGQAPGKGGPAQHPRGPDVDR